MHPLTCGLSRKEEFVRVGGRRVSVERERERERERESAGVYCV